MAGGINLPFVELGDVNIAHLCDIDERVLAKAGKMAAGWAGQKPALTSDLRRVLDDKSVDAVVRETKA